MKLKDKLSYYYFAAIFSVIFAAVGFAYNTWRMEVSEENNNTRTAAFEVLLVLAEFEQVIYSAHYDKDPVAGSPRTGWVKIGLAQDLSVLLGKEVQDKINELHIVWYENWATHAENREKTDLLVATVSDAREAIKAVLAALD